MSANTTVAALATAEILEDDELRPREVVQENVVSEYAQRMKAGTVFPPVLVYEINSQYWLVDGYHRVAAARLNGQDRLVCEVRKGTHLDASWVGCASNLKHGLRRTNADKRRAVLRALAHPKGQRLSDRQISYHCGVHHDTVGRYRRELELSGGIRRMEVRVSRRGNSTYLQYVESIAQSNASRARAVLSEKPSTSNTYRSLAHATLDEMVTALKTASELIASVEEQIGKVAQELSCENWERALESAVEARHHCSQIQRAVNAIQILMSRGIPVGQLSQSGGTAVS